MLELVREHHLGQERAEQDAEERRLDRVQEESASIVEPELRVRRREPVAEVSASANSGPGAQSDSVEESKEQAGRVWRRDRPASKRTPTRCAPATDEQQKDEGTVAGLLFALEEQQGRLRE